MKKLKRWWALLWPKFETPTYDFSTLVTDLFSKWNSVLFDGFKDLTHVFSFIKCFSHKALIQDNANGPDLSFLVIDIALKRFWSHIRGRSNIILKRGFWIPLNLTVAEINNFWNIIMEHYICWFQVSVYNFVSDKTIVAF